MGAHTMYVSQESPANALATNKDATQVVIAGRSVFKIFSIEEEEFVEKINLRVGKNLNLNFSCADVVWNPMEDNILATAATNGAVVLWRLDKPSHSKQDMVFQDHRRTVNKVSFHPTEPHNLISGSQDGTMKLFDLRKKEVILTFYSNAESVRDVQFSPHQFSLFAAVQENGNVQVWDLRRPDRYERQFTAHSGPVFACDWHPEEKRWLATAGRDKTIKIWDHSASKPNLHTIQTIASVSRIRWRPQRKFHIASSALVVDFSVNIWDIRRPYIPFAAFNEHKDVTTGIAWRHDPHVFLSTSKDCTLYQHVFHDAVRPADHANPMGLDINSYGDVSLAASDKILNDGPNNKGTYSSTRLPHFFRTKPSMSDQFRAAYSSLHVFPISRDKHMSMNWLVESAKQYQLIGRSLAEVCDHNASVATSLDRPEVAQSWSMLKLLYSCNLNIINSDLSRPTQIEAHRQADLDKVLQVLENSHLADGQANDQRSVRHLSGSNHRHHSGGNHGERQPGDTSTGFSEEDTETDDTEHEWTLTTIASGMANTHSDLFCDGDGIGNFGGLDIEQIDGLDGLDDLDGGITDWNLPSEAFQPRHEILDRSTPPEQIMDLSRPIRDEDSTVEDDTGQHSSTTLTDADEQTPPFVIIPSALHFPSWDCNPVVVDMLYHYAAQGDVQMSVSVIIVLGERIRGQIDEQTQEQWFMSYLDLLAHFQLWSIANTIIKMSSLGSVNSLNHTSTTVHTNCNQCQRPLIRMGWICDRCKALTNTCSICHHVVKGLYVWCQGCSHGGHLQHVKEWIRNNPWCPTGCGHRCEY